MANKNKVGTDVTIVGIAVVLCVLWFLLGAAVATDYIKRNSTSGCGACCFPSEATPKQLLYK